MKKLLKALLVLVLLAVIGLVVALVFIDSLARKGVEAGAAYALGVPTTLDSADVGVMDGTFSMKGLEVSNPKGFTTPHFMTLAQGDVALSLASLRQDTIELPKLTLDGVDMNLEKKGGSSNYNIILENLKKLESGPAEDRRKFIIREVEIRNVMVHVDVVPIGGGLTRLDVPIEPITMRDIGSGGEGVPLAELTAVMTKAIFAAIVERGGGLIPADIAGELGRGLEVLDDLGKFGVSVGGKTLDGVGKAVQDIAEGAAEAGKKIGEEADKALKGIGDVLGGNKKKDE